MTRTVVTALRDTPIHEAAALLAEHGIASMPVRDEDGRVVGMLSEADLIRDRMPRDPRSHLRPDDCEQPDPGRLAGDVMTPTVICLGENADTAELAALMLDNNLRAVPITDGCSLRGIVSRRDLLRTLLRPDNLIDAEVRLRLDEFAGEPDRWSVAVKDGVVTISGRFDDDAREANVTLLVRTVPGVIRVHTRLHR